METYETNTLSRTYCICHRCGFRDDNHVQLPRGHGFTPSAGAAERQSCVSTRTAGSTRTSRTNRASGRPRFSGRYRKYRSARANWHGKLQLEWQCLDQPWLGFLVRLVCRHPRKLFGRRCDVIYQLLLHGRRHMRIHVLQRRRLLNAILMICATDLYDFNCLSPHRRQSP